MSKIGKGPNALMGLLGKELNEGQPPWETIQAQTKEYAQLASAMEQEQPRKGSKESWAKLTSEFSGTAAELDRAAQAKEKDAALAAHGQLAKSCMACHREHRGMGPGMGRPPGFGPPGGPPPGGPGFGPPGGPPPGGPPPGGPGFGPPPGAPDGSPPEGPPPK